MGVPKRVQFDDLETLVENGIALLRELLKDDFPRGISKPMPHWKKLLKYARAARKRGVWPKVRWLLSVLETDARDSRAYRWKNFPPSTNVREAVLKTCAAYRDAESSLLKLDRVLALACVDGAGAVRPDAIQRLRDVRAVVHQNMEQVRAFPDLLVALGKPGVDRRLSLPMPTRLGWSRLEDVANRNALEDVMVELGFSQSQIAILIDGPAGNAKDRGRKVANRRRARNKPRVP